MCWWCGTCRTGRAAEPDYPKAGEKVLLISYNRHPKKFPITVAVKPISTLKSWLPKSLGRFKL